MEASPFSYISPPVTHGQMESAVAGVAASIPSASSADPAPIAVAPLPGAAAPYARADHVHASKSRRGRVPTAADGTLTWVYPVPFDTGVVPQIQAIVETAVGVTDVLNVQIEGMPTNVSAKLRVTRTNQSFVSLLGLTILSIPSNVGVQMLHLSAFG